MSYERRLEIEALPAEEGWGKWVAVIGHGRTLVERKDLAPVRLWVVGGNGPIEVEAYRYERWRFAEQVSANTTKPADSRGFSYTQWHTDREYTDYSLSAKDISMMCAETREELCRKVCEKLDGEMQSLFMSLKKLESRRADFINL